METVIQNLDLFFQGWLGTLKICGAAVIGALVLGVLLAAARVSPVPVLQRFAAGYLFIVLNCPLAVVLFFIAFGLPQIGINGSYFAFGICGLILYTAAFVCEALRGGINSVGVGQAEAARSLGLGIPGILRRVILPQALRSSLPPMTNVLVQMIKNSAIVGAFGVGGDLFKVADSLVAGQGLPAIPILAGVIVGYMVTIMPVAALMGALERKVAVVR
jgi:glutamate transport system permease protein